MKNENRKIQQTSRQTRTQEVREKCLPVVIMIESWEFEQAIKPVTVQTAIGWIFDSEVLSLYAN